MTFIYLFLLLEIVVVLAKRRTL